MDASLDKGMNFFLLRINIPGEQLGAETDPHIMPCRDPFLALVPVSVNAGDAELLFDEIGTWVEKGGRCRFIASAVLYMICFRLLRFLVLRRARGFLRSRLVSLCVGLNMKGEFLR